MADYNSGQGFAFLTALAKYTGLNPDVIRAWMLAEGGPTDNPLNIGPGKHYSDPAKATSDLLHTPRYAPILTAAAHGNPQQQLAAIAASPWDANHYRGNSSSQGALLRGTYARVTHGKGGGLAGAVKGAEGAVAAPVQAVADIPGAIGGAVSNAEGWLAKEFVVLGSYTVLLVAALALFVLGALRATGTDPRELAASGAAKGEIPF